MLLNKNCSQMKNLKKYLLLTALLLLSAAAQAKVELPSILSDNMVLQQKAQVALWGTATGKTVTITASWSKAKTVVKPGADGKWFARIATPEAGGPYELCFNDGEKTVVKNILIGEVWFCSGQSNMEMPMRGWGGQPIEHATECIMKAKPSTPIRMVNFKHGFSTVPVYESKETWQENTPEVVYECSATAYFFALKMQEILNVPIGIITADWGGSSIEAWMRRDILEKEFPGEFDTAFLDTADNSQLKRTTPSVLYNGILCALMPYTFKGMLWYQGEENRLRPEQYVRLQPRFVQMIREDFQNPDAPFYFVQIAPYKYSGEGRPFTSGYFFEAQQKTLALIPHCGMVPTVDLGNYNFIHPPKKMEVGNRLAMMALVNDYGIKGLHPNAPYYKSVTFDGGKALITVDVEKSVGLIPASVPVSGFELAGEDRVFHPATASAFRDQITVECPEVSAPVAVRYCFRNWGEGTLFNVNGIPLLPFRTDDWNDLHE